MLGGYQSILYSISERPLEYWSKKRSQTGRICKIVDHDLLESVVEIQDSEGTNVSNTFIACPSNTQQLLNVKLPLLILIIKNLNLECCIKLQIIDTNKFRRYFQFHCSNSEDKYARNPTCCHIKVKLESGWNRLELDLHNLTDTVFKSKYEETQRLQICANCRLRRVYFIDKHYDENEICPKLYQNFLDIYMAKWGIHTVNRETQTADPCTAATVKSLESEKKIFSVIDESSNRDREKSVRNRAAVSHNLLAYRENQLKSLNFRTDQFFYGVQVKCSELIENFFSRHSFKLNDISEFLRQAPIKRYAVPMRSKSNERVSLQLHLSAIPKEATALNNKFNGASRKLEKGKPRGKESRYITEENWIYRYLHLNEKFAQNFTIGKKSNAYGKVSSSIVMMVGDERKGDKNDNNNNNNNNNDKITTNISNQNRISITARINDGNYSPPVANDFKLLSNAKRRQEYLHKTIFDIKQAYKTNGGLVPKGKNP